MGCDRALKPHIKLFRIGSSIGRRYHQCQLSSSRIYHHEFEIPSGYHAEHKDTTLSNLWFGILFFFCYLWMKWVEINNLTRKRWAFGYCLAISRTISSEKSLWIDASQYWWPLKEISKFVTVFRLPRSQEVISNTPIYQPPHPFRENKMDGGPTRSTNSHRDARQPYEYTESEIICYRNIYNPKRIQ